MIVKTAAELEGLRRAGQVVALTLAEMKKHVRPGITTKELDEIGAATLAVHGARSAPITMYDFPGATCISVNEEAAHGIPGPRVIKTGDLVNIDVSAQVDGFFADTGATIAVEPVKEIQRQVCRCSQEALAAAIAVCKTNVRINEIGRAIEKTAAREGFNTIKNLCGHGIGRSLHEEPHNIMNFYSPFVKGRLEQGVVLAIETFVTTGPDLAQEAEDGWTLKLPVGTWVAQYEHTIVVTDKEPLVLTMTSL